MGTRQNQLQFTITNPYQIVMNVSRLFVLDSHLSAVFYGKGAISNDNIIIRLGQTYSSPHLTAGQLPLRIINGELVFYIRKGTWGGGAYYIGGVCGVIRYMTYLLSTVLIFKRFCYEFN